MGPLVPYYEKIVHSTIDHLSLFTFMYFSPLTLNKVFPATYKSTISIMYLRIPECIKLSVNQLLLDNK